MKTIVLFRHGKSDWEAGHDADHERPLAPRGRKTAARMGRVLAAISEVPGKVLTSPAVRAHDSVLLAAEAGGWEAPIEVAPELYSSSPEEVIARVRQEADAGDSLLVAGHEPTWSELAAALIGGGRLRFPTAAMARIDLHVERWSDVAPGTGTLIWFLVPRLVKGAGRAAQSKTRP
jgi:phosphohistidine phosphatase